MGKKFKINILGFILSLILNALVLVILVLVIINVTTISFNFGREYVQEVSEYNEDI